jgi:hypothetical protein
MTYFDKDWILHEKEFTGIKCRILQGHMWIDIVSSLRKKLLISN